MTSSPQEMKDKGQRLGKYITNLVLSKIETDKGRKKVT